jgi:methylenetetrahydrofolate reductase (NADPH)
MKERTIIELLTPRQDAEDLDAALDRYATRHRLIMDNGYILSVPDNPMGQPHFQVMEVVRELDLPVQPQNFLLHINTFHAKADLDGILAQAEEMKVRQLLIVTGDGSERLAKLDPASIGADTQSATSVELLRYIHARYPGRFSTAVAFNPYEPLDHELEKMERKIAAGAEIAITQPVIGTSEPVARLQAMGIPVTVGAWMSKRIDLLSECVGYELAPAETFDPVGNLRELIGLYPACGMYLSLINYKRQWDAVREILP